MVFELNYKWVSNLPGFILTIVTVIYNYILAVSTQDSYMCNSVPDI